MNYTLTKSPSSNVVTSIEMSTLVTMSITVNKSIWDETTSATPSSRFSLHAILRCFMKHALENHQIHRAIDVDSITRPGNKASILPTATTDELYTSYNE